MSGAQKPVPAAAYGGWFAAVKIGPTRRQCTRSSDSAIFELSLVRPCSSYGPPVANPYHVPSLARMTAGSGKSIEYPCVTGLVYVAGPVGDAAAGVVDPTAATSARSSVGTKAIRRRSIVVPLGRADGSVVI